MQLNWVINVVYTHLIDIEIQALGGLMLSGLQTQYLLLRRT